MNKATVNGAELEYEINGSGEPVLLIGTGPIADSFLPLWSAKALAERHCLIRYHQRRLADGTDGPSPVSFAHHAADAAELLGQLNIRRAHVMGHSTGAAIALQLAVDSPDAVHTLALLEPPLMGTPGAEAFLNQAGSALAAYASGEGDRAMAEFLSAVCGLDWDTCRQVIDKYVPGGAAEAMRDADNFFGSYLPALSAWQFGPEQAASISQPVLSVLGAETNQWFIDADQLLHAWFPQIETRRIEGVAHLLHLQRPQPVVASAAEFFARHPMRGESVPEPGRPTSAIGS